MKGAIGGDQLLISTESLVSEVVSSTAVGSTALIVIGNVLMVIFGPRESQAYSLNVRTIHTILSILRYTIDPRNNCLFTFYISSFHCVQLDSLSLANKACRICYTFYGMLLPLCTSAALSLG